MISEPPLIFNRCWDIPDATPETSPTGRQRQTFIAGCCYFQAVPGYTETRRELERVETAIIERLQPVYVGRIGR